MIVAFADASGSLRRKQFCVPAAEQLSDALANIQIEIIYAFRPIDGDARN